MRVKSNKPKRSIWTETVSRYGTYEGEYGSAAEWAASFQDAWSGVGAKEIIKDESPWGILGVAAGSTLDEVKSAFRKLIMKNHPDKGGDAELCKKIIAAYTTLQGMLK